VNEKNFKLYLFFLPFGYLHKIDKFFVKKSFLLPVQCVQFALKGIIGGSIVEMRMDLPDKLRFIQ
jgi:hypothetical protein